MEVQDKSRGGCYGSFWPAKGLSTNPKEAHLSNYTEQIERTFEQDVKSEGGKPEIETVFYSLDTQKMVEEHDTLKQKARKYVLKTKSNPKYRDEKTENCSSFAYLLLKAGGINSLSPKCACLENQLYALTPNKLGDCVEDAKREELRRHPETQQFERKKLRL